MEKLNLGTIKQAPLVIGSSNEKQEVTNDNHKNNENKDNKKILLSLAGLSAIAAGAVALYKNKNPKFNIQFTNKDGVAYLKGTEEKFTGTVVKKLKSGDRITLEYSDGIIQKSKREGKVTFEKIFEIVDGKHKVTIKRGNDVKCSIIEDIKEAAIKDQEAYKKLIADSDSLSLEEFLEKSKIKCLSKAQKQEISSIAEQKEKLALKTRIAVEKLAAQEAHAKIASLIDNVKNNVLDNTPTQQTDMINSAYEQWQAASTLAQKSDNIADLVAAYEKEGDYIELLIKQVEQKDASVETEVIINKLRGYSHFIKLRMIGIKGAIS